MEGTLTHCISLGAPSSLRSIATFHSTKAFPTSANRGSGDGMGIQKSTLWYFGPWLKSNIVGKGSKTGQIILSVASPTMKRASSPDGKQGVRGEN